MASHRDARVEHSLFSWRSYAIVLFSFAAAIVITDSFLFKNLDLLELVTPNNLLWTTINFFGVCAMATVIWGLYRRRMIQRPVEKVLAFTKAMTEGDFSARIPMRDARLRNEFDVLMADLNHMAGELGGVEALRSDFVASVSHEIKTPLSVITNYTALMRDPALTEQERIECAEKCGIAAKRLSGMVGNILRLNKLENQTIFPQVRQFDLSEQLAECVFAFEDIFDERNLELEVSVPEGVSVTGDPELLELVWNNLVSNAIKFTDSGGRVTLRLLDEGERVSVEVADTGCGISQKSIAHIFDKFYQADESHFAQGNGLGLALVARIVKLHGGKVEVQSELGAGSTFVARIPKQGALVAASKD